MWPVLRSASRQSTKSSVMYRVLSGLAAGAINGCQGWPLICRNIVPTIRMSLVMSVTRLACMIQYSNVFDMMIWPDTYLHPFVDVNNMVEGLEELLVTI